MSAKSADLKKEVTSVTPAIPENGVNKAGVMIAIQTDGDVHQFDRTGVMSARGTPTDVMTVTGHPTGGMTDHHTHATTARKNVVTTIVTGTALESGIKADTTTSAEPLPHQEPGMMQHHTNGITHLVLRQIVRLSAREAAETHPESVQSPATDAVTKVIFQGTA